MFSPALGRAVRSTCAVVSSCSVASRPTTTASITATTLCLSRSLQQRRFSSSKPSVPPDSPKTPQKGPSQTATRSVEKKTSGRSRKKAPALNVPHVPSTDHLKHSDVGLSSFFSLHRPISITAPLPKATSESSFGSIFEPKKQDAAPFNDVIYTLANTVDGMDGAVQAFEEGEHADQVYHLDGNPKLSVDRLVAQYRPFHPPPPPVPFEAPSNEAAAKEPQARVARKPKQKSWKTTIVVTESTESDGSRSYTAATSPMVEIPVPARAPFVDRARLRQQRWREYRWERAQQEKKDMFLISVKRQRKLKMKKHKYKKLMKRTRILRRKLEKS